VFALQTLPAYGERVDAGVQLLELLLLKGLADARAFLSSSAEGRENRDRVKAYFGEHGLEIKEGYIALSLLDTYKVHALGLYNRGCDAGDAESCKFLAFAYRDGDVVGQNKVYAVRLFQKACALGSTHACKFANK